MNDLQGHPETINAHQRVSSLLTWELQNAIGQRSNFKTYTKVINFTRLKGPPKSRPSKDIFKGKVNKKNRVGLGRVLRRNQNNDSWKVSTCRNVMS